jgi:hypothetical protein
MSDQSMNVFNEPRTKLMAAKKLMKETTTLSLWRYCRKGYIIQVKFKTAHYKDEVINRREINYWCKDQSIMKVVASHECNFLLS